jgi:hypothetical protein
VRPALQLCGGHGYASASALPALAADYVASCTLEVRGAASFSLMLRPEMLRQEMLRLDAACPPRGTATRCGAGACSAPPAC